MFLLSPASSTGKRCQQLLAPEAGFELALRLRHEGAPLGEVFSFMSALYFRGKLTYARRFAAPPPDCAGVQVITPHRGLVAPERELRLGELRAFAEVEIDARDERYAAPLRESAEALRSRLPRDGEVVLLGSIATAKYVDVLLPLFGRSLLFPSDFVGRGDMSRGGLLLRAARDGTELAYRPVDGAARRGGRPPKLDALRRPFRV